jgi:hypothetical protein
VKLEEEELLEAIHAWQDVGRPLPSGLALAHLRMWGYRISTDTAAKMPSVRQLAAEWGWTRMATQRLKSDVGTWVGQEWDTRPSPNADNQASVGQKWDSSGTADFSYRSERSFSSDSARVRAPGTDRELEVAELLALQESDEPQFGFNQARDKDALRRALLRGTPFTSLKDLWACSAVSDHPMLAPCRVGWRRWSALLKSPNGEARLEVAGEWVRTGRSTVTPTPRGQVRRFRIRDLKLAEESDE